MLPSSDQLTAIGAIITALTGFATVILAAVNRRTIKSTQATVVATHENTITENGSTLGENSDAVRNVVAPKTPDGDAPAQPAA